MESTRYAHIDPPRNGACLVAKERAAGVRFVAALAQGVQAAAVQQNLAGEMLDDVELHAVEGRFDWRAYVRREFRTARERSQPGVGF